jgi:hypothetical protein
LRGREAHAECEARSGRRDQQFAPHWKALLRLGWWPLAEPFSVPRDDNELCHREFRRIAINARAARVSELAFTARVLLRNN